MENLLKQELHKLVDDCDNETLLMEAKNVLLAASKDDWWNEMSENDKNLLQDSEAEYNAGDFITHKQLMQQFEEWKKK